MHIDERANYFLRISHLREFQMTPVRFEVIGIIDSGPDEGAGAGEGVGLFCGTGFCTGGVIGGV